MISGDIISFCFFLGPKRWDHMSRKDVKIWKKRFTVFNSTVLLCSQNAAIFLYGCIDRKGSILILPCYIIFSEVLWRSSSALQ